MTRKNNHPSRPTAALIATVLGLFAVCASSAQIQPQAVQATTSPASLDLATLFVPSIAGRNLTEADLSETSLSETNPGINPLRRAPVADSSPELIAYFASPPEIYAQASQPAQTTKQQPSSLPDAPVPAKSTATAPRGIYGCTIGPCKSRIVNWYMRFEDGPQARPMTPLEKGWLATRNVIDPFNIVTILGISAISVAADSHSAYGPGFTGWGRYVGVSFTEDITGEFFGTFLICTIAHQDPHYHRMPDASIKRRIAHAIYQVAWTQGDNGNGMLNYSDLLGAGIDDEIANLYVPGRQTNGIATAQRYGIALATAPIDNFITEFLPDVAKRIHIQVVVVQRIIDQIAENRANNGSS